MLAGTHSPWPLYLLHLECCVKFLQLLGQPWFSYSRWELRSSKLLFLPLSSRFWRLLHEANRGAHSLCCHCTIPSHEKCAWILWLLWLHMHVWAQHHLLLSGSNFRCPLQVVWGSWVTCLHLIRCSSSWPADLARPCREDKKGNKDTEVKITFPRSYCCPCQSLHRPQLSQCLSSELSPAPENLSRVI